MAEEKKLIVVLNKGRRHFDVHTELDKDGLGVGKPTRVSPGKTAEMSPAAFAKLSHYTELVDVAKVPARESAAKLKAENAELSKKNAELEKQLAALKGGEGEGGKKPKGGDKDK